MKASRLILAATVLAFATSVRAADTYTIKTEVFGTVIDFTVPSNFLEDGCPKQGDIVTFESTSGSFVVNDTTIEGFSKLAEVQMKYGCSVTIDVDVDHEIPTAIYGVGTYVTKLVKNGTGRLTLTSAKVVKSSLYTDYYTDIFVKGGTLSLPGKDMSSQLSLVGMTIDADCAVNVGLWQRVRLEICTGGYGGLNGAGTLTVAGVESGSANRLYVTGGDFSGKLLGKFDLFPVQQLNLRGTENVFTGAVWAVEGTIGVQSFGTGGESSSIGRASAPDMSTIWFRSATTEKPGTLLYLGEGEETSRVVSFSDASHNTTVFPRISGGEFGGLVFGSDSVWETRTTSVIFPQKLVLDGSGAKPCVMRGKLKLAVDGGTTVPFYLMKEGIGIWAMEGDKDYWNTWTVKNGTLRFNSLEERGLSSALGNAKDCTDVPIHPTAPASVDYAFRLGDEGTTGMLEYTGTNLVFCTTRPVELVGNGGFKNDSPVPFRFDGVTVQTAGDKTFYLDGASTCSNEIAGICDAADRKVSIVKNGAGTWVLNGSNTLHGTIAVNGGKLIVRKDARKYTWFKFLMRRNYHGDSSSLRVSEIGLYSAKINSANETVQVNKGLTVVTDAIPHLNPGEAILPRHHAFSVTSSENLSKLFNGSTTEPGAMSYGSAVSDTNPMGQIPIIMRLADGSDEVCSYDVETTFGIGNSPGYMLRAFTLYGSVDGIHWEVLSDKYYETDGDLPGTYGWYSGVGSDKHGNMPIAGSRATDPTFTVLDNVTGVSVAKGASLEVVGTETAPVISNLVVSATGAGAIDGFAFAENGTISLTDDPLTERSLRVDWDFSKAANIANLSNWKVLVNGVENKRTLASVDATGGTFDKPGLVVIVK